MRKLMRNYSNNRRRLIFTNINWAVISKTCGPRYLNCIHLWSKLITFAHSTNWNVLMSWKMSLSRRTFNLIFISYVNAHVGMVVQQNLRILIVSLTMYNDFIDTLIETASRTQASKILFRWFYRAPLMNPHWLGSLILFSKLEIFRTP